MVALTPLDRIERGREAAQLLQHPLLVGAFEGVRTGIFTQWEDAGDAETRHNLWAGLHGAKRIEAWLKAIVDDGAIAAHEAAQQKAEDV